MILSSKTIEIFVEGRHTAIEVLAIVMFGDGLLAPIESGHHLRALRRLAASNKARVGFGGFSSRSSTRAVSRSDRMIRSLRSTNSRAAGNTRRMMKLVTSSRSWAAAATKTRFSSFVARISIRSSRATASDAMSASYHWQHTVRTASVQIKAGKKWAYPGARLED